MIQCLKTARDSFFLSFLREGSPKRKEANSLRLHSFERADVLVMFTMWAHMTAELIKTNARDAADSSCRQQTTQGACVSNRVVQDRARRLNQSHFRPIAEVSFLPSANTRKRASTSREAICMYPQIGCKQKCQWIRAKKRSIFLCLLP